MYTVYVSPDRRRFRCHCVIQDGTERWEEESLEKAIASLVSAARVLNHDHIPRSAVDVVYEEPEVPPPVSDADREILAAVRSGRLRTLPFDHYLLRYNLTEEECRTVQAVREGRLRVVPDE